MARVAIDYLRKWSCVVQFYTDSKYVSQTKLISSKKFSEFVLNYWHIFKKHSNSIHAIV